jgi:hypothetical protein
MFKYLVMASMVLGFSVAQAKKEDKKTEREPQSQTVKESKEEKYQVLGMIFKVNQLSVSSFGGGEEGASVSIFEMGGGDPAMNGNNLFVSICPNSNEKSCSHFPYVLNINALKKASIDAAKKSIIIEGSEDYMNSNGEIKNRKVTYGIRYDWKADGTVKDTLTTYRIK